MSSCLYSEFKDVCRKTLKNSLVELKLADKIDEIVLLEPPSPNYGEMSTTLCFELSRKLKKNPLELAKQLTSHIKIEKNLLESVEVAGNGYVNFKMNFSKATQRIIADTLSADSTYGLLPLENPGTVIVEHTSVNPVHPIHIGQARNPVLGDALAKLMKARGYQVKRHYYIDDMGRQSAILAYGYQLLGTPPVDGKPDQFLGKLYSVTSCLVEIQNLKRKINELSKSNSHNKDEQIKQAQRELDDWSAVALELKNKHPTLFDQLSISIIKEENPELEISQIIKEYEGEKDEVKRLIRKVSDLALEGFKSTLNKLEIFFDSWDWESDIVWSGQVNTLIDHLKRSSYVTYDQGSLELDIEQIVATLSLRENLQVSESHHFPSLTLIRSDGTTLYTTRDMAYSLFKFERGKKVINVIGAEQSLAQLQLKAALYALGEDDKARNLIHFAFGLVEMPGHRMSSRRGRIITLDEVLNEALERAYQEVRKRDKTSSQEECQRIADTIGIASIKYALLSVEPLRTVTFTWDRVLDFEKNSIPFINYAYTRALGILKKLGKKPQTKIDGTKLTHPLEKRALIQIAKFPVVFKEAVDNLRPNEITNFTNKLAELFHEYYEKVNVIASPDEDTRLARAALIKALAIVIRNAMEIIGIKLTEKM